MADAQIRLRLDTSGARSDLRGLYDEMRRAPAVRPGGAGGGSGPAGLSGGGQGAGGFDLASILARLTTVIAAQQMVGAAGPAALGAGLDFAREAVLGPQLGTARGAVAARDAVANRFGLAYDLGVMSDDLLRQQYDVEMQFGVGRQTKGAARAKAALQGEMLGTMGEAASDRLRTVLSGLTDAINGLRGMTGGGGS